MKKIFVAFLAFCLLVLLCACDIPTPFIDVEKYKHPQETSSGTQENGDNDGEIVPDPQEFGIEIKKQDLSLTNDDGSRKIELTYDLISVPDSSDAYKKINAAANDDFSRFKKINEIAPDHISASNKFHNIYTAEVTNTSNNVLSVKYKTSWYMGGIEYEDYYGLNFDLKTGKLLTLADMTEDDEKILNSVKGTVKSYLESNSVEVYTDRYKLDISRFKLDRLKFFVQSNRIFICIETCSLAHQDAGAMNIKTDIEIDENGKLTLK